MDKRVYTTIEGFEAEVDLDIVLTEANSRHSEYGTALILAGPLAGYEVIISSVTLDKLQQQWEKQNDLALSTNAAHRT